jgi:PAS domain S-box-containing protein
MAQTILDYTPFFLCHCSRDLRYIRVSKSYAALLGRAPEDIVGNPIVDIMGAEGFETVRPHVEAVLRGERVEYEASVNLAGVGPRQYHVIYVPERDEQSQVVGYVASILDVTERNRAIEEQIRLERLVTQMQVPLAHARIGIWDTDMRTGQVSCTPELEAIFGLEVTGLRSRTDFRNLIHPDDRDDLFARRDEAIKAHRPFQLEHRIIRPDGQTCWVMVAGAAVYDQITGEPIRIMGNCIDITEGKAAEAEAELRRNELTHLMRVATLGGLSGGIAHELSQPLAAILANVKAAQVILAKKEPDLPAIAEILEEIAHDDHRAGQVIRHLRTLLQKGERCEEVISLNDLIVSTLQLLHSELATRKITVNTELRPDLPSISGDSVELQQVLINLIMNAIEAMASTPPSERALYVVTEETRQGNVAVSIRDRGPGMPPDKQKRIFEPFFTTKVGGLGLGLSICSTIVALHRGQLDLRNASEGGLVATVSLPKSAQLAIAS